MYLDVVVLVRLAFVGATAIVSRFMAASGPVAERTVGTDHILRTCFSFQISGLWRSII